MNQPIFLEQPCHLPDRHTPGRMVQWHVFRDFGEAVEYASHVVLGQGQHITGGWDYDSVGKLWWIGVEVEDMARGGDIAQLILDEAAKLIRFGRRCAGRIKSTGN